MFTGLVEGVANVCDVQSTTGGIRISVDAGPLVLGDVRVGDSVALDGVCLTVVARAPQRLEFDVSAETLNNTVGFALGAAVNLERSLSLGDRLGGHLVSGHVDGVGRVVRFNPVGDNRHLVVAAPRDLNKYIARKGSIAVNGVSLTVNAVTGDSFDINLIPHTLRASNLGALSAGAKVNLEVDLLARYVERLLEQPTP
jgi:riboflavin synthase